VIAMAFEYACFISYRHSHEPGVQKIYESFRRELATQVGLYLPGMQVYLDTGRLSGGDFFNKELAFALCSSICMVSLYNPLYFDTSSTYAAREYQAMVNLEGRRLPGMPEEAQKKGLIIPLIIRGSLPDEIKNNRQSYTLDLLTPGDLRKPKSLEVLRKVADDIYNRYVAFRMAAKDPCSYCEDFEFPSEGEIMEWLTGITAPPQKMPWRR
jgi:hypothetical protein